MTSSINDITTVDTSVAKAAQTAPPRKRRRRTAATGAAEDCFTCRKRQVKCDRRRPYCTQCLEIGKDCTGYRTTLTWGVGVASRGKLRGLSLPIANSTKKAPTSNDDGKSQRTSAAKATLSPSSSSAQMSSARSEDDFSSSYHHSPELGSTMYSSGNYSPTSPIPIPPQQAHSGWHVPSFGDHVDGYHNLLGKPARLQIRPNPLRRIHTTATASYDEVAYSTPSSAFSDSDYPSPSEFPATPEDYSIPEPLVSSYSESYSCPPEHAQPLDNYGYLETPRSFPATTAFNAPVVTSATNTSNSYGMLPSSSSPTTFSDLLHCNDYTPTNELSQSYPVAQKVDHDYFPDGLSDFSVSVPSTWPALQPTLETSGHSGIPPRMQFLLGSYSKTICPLLVAFDDERNPYRLHVMAHLNSSLPLQYAVAALVSDQIRGRRASEPTARALSGADGSPNDFKNFDSVFFKQNDADYKSLATNAFNAALKDSNSAGDESVLITLLVLCLLHFSESGVGNFKIGLTRIKKLLAIHMGGSEVLKSEAITWIETWFVWLDIISSTIGDSATRPHSEALAALDRSAYLGSVEYLANCQGQLFNAVARLKEWSLSLTRLAPSRDFYGHSSAASLQFEMETSRSFWAPLSQVQNRLKTVTNHPNYHDTEADPLISSYITSCFECAAAIYEVYASQDFADSCARIQGVVAHFIHSISGIPSSSCVNEFILWPLLIVGTECVQENDREIVRHRIAKVTTGSLFFQEFSCVEVLSKVWALIDLGLASTKMPTELRDSWPRLSSLGARGAIWYDAMAVLEHSSCAS